MKVGYQQGKYLLAFFDERRLYEHSIASSEFLRIYPIQLPKDALKLSQQYIILGLSGMGISGIGPF